MTETEAEEVLAIYGSIMVARGFYYLIGEHITFKSEYPNKEKALLNIVSFLESKLKKEIEFLESRKEKI